MDNDMNSYGPPHIVGNIYTIFSMAFGLITWSGAEEGMRLLSGALSIMAGIMAIRYYQIATRKKKEEK